MGTTTNHSLRYPEDANAVAVPADVKKLADDVDAKLISTAGGTVSGNFSFTGAVTVQTPSTNTNPTTKLYVDNALATRDSSIAAINTELGTNPSGTYSTVKDRLDDIVTPVLAANGKTRVTHPNTDDVLVETWDATQNRWQRTYYDSGWRDITGLVTPPSGMTGLNLQLRRVNYTIEYILGWNQNATVPPTPAFTFTVPVGFRFASNLADLTTAFFSSSGVHSGGVYSLSGGDQLAFVAIASQNIRQSFTHSIRVSGDQAIPSSLPGTLSLAAPY